MFEKKFLMSLLCLVVVLGLSATATRGANILFVASMTAEGDDALKAFMEGLGHTVTYIDDDEDEATTEAAAAAADMVFISESVSSGKIKNEITELEVPMIVGEPYAWDEMGLTEGGGGDDAAVTTDVEIVDPGHYLAAGLSGTVAVLTDILEGCNLGKGITGPEATVIATATLVDGVTYDVIFVYEKGAALPVAPADGSAQVAADIRVGFGFHANCTPVLSENAYALLGAAVDYALGQIPTLQVLERSISAESDDAEEDVGGGSGFEIDLDSTDLELVYDNDVTNPLDEQVVGIRFVDIAIPKGSTIVSASVRFDADDVDDAEHVGDAYVIIEGELSPNPVTFENTPLNITGRPRTTALVPWGPLHWTVKHEKYSTADISSIIQEIVDQDGWASGNALVLIFSQDPLTPSTGIVEPESFTDNATENIERRPTLIIEYEALGGPAEDPQPADGTSNIRDTYVNLTWTPGQLAATHDVYISDNLADVDDGTPVASTTDASYTVGLDVPGDPYPGGLAPGTTYYWRIDEVQADGTTVYKGDIWSFSIAPQTAFGPDPVDGAIFVRPNVILSWEPGLGAVAHDVYFGDNSADVDAGTGDTFKGSTPDLTYTPDTLERGEKAYYWRVDANDGVATHKGDVWSFTTVLDLPILDPNLLARWTLDEGKGAFAIDSSGNDNYGDVVGATWVADGQIRGALEFDGDDYVDCGNASMLDFGTGDWTLTAWMKATVAPAGDTTIVGKGGDHSGGIRYQVMLDSDNYIHLVVDDDTDKYDPGGETPVIDGQWHHIVMMRRDGTTLRLYVDGVEDMGVTNHGESTIPDTYDLSGTSQHNAYIGAITDNRDPTGNTLEKLFAGTIDDVRIYDKALSEAEILERMMPQEIWFEAEAADLLGSKWRIGDHPHRRHRENEPTASGESYIGSNNTDGTHNDTAPGAEWIASYNFTALGGVYKVALRTISPNLVDNSLWVRIPGALSQTYEDPDQAGTGWVRFNDIDQSLSWKWSEVHSDDHKEKVVNWTLVAGDYTLEIAKREDGAFLDAILITDALDIDEDTLPDSIP